MSTKYFSRESAIIICGLRKPELTNEYLDQSKQAFKEAQVLLLSHFDSVQEKASKILAARRSELPYIQISEFSIRDVNNESTNLGLVFSLHKKRFLAVRSRLFMETAADELNLKQEMTYDELPAKIKVGCVALIFPILKIHLPREVFQKVREELDPFVNSDLFFSKAEVDRYASFQERLNNLISRWFLEVPATEEKDELMDMLGFVTNLSKIQGCIREGGKIDFHEVLTNLKDMRSYLISSIGQELYDLQKDDIEFLIDDKLSEID